MHPIIAFALKRRLIVVVAIAALFGAGVLAFTRLNIEAYPIRCRRLSKSLPRAAASRRRKSSANHDSRRNSDGQESRT